MPVLTLSFLNRILIFYSYAVAICSIRAVYSNLHDEISTTTDDNVSNTTNAKVSTTPNEVISTTADDEVSTKPIFMEYIPQELLENRIKGGKNTNIRNYPFLVSIQKQFIPRCVGSLITDSLIITAAHCLIDMNKRTTFILNPADFIIISGSTVLSPGSTTGQERQAQQFVLHSRFERPLLKYDVGIIETTEPFILGPTTKPTKLYTMPPEVITFFQYCTLISWVTGKHSFNDYEVPELNPNSMELQMIQMKIMNAEECLAILNRLTSMDIVCTHLHEQCPGQSGSPLICGESLFGVYTWTAGCTNSSYPAIFVQISKVYFWISNVINEQYVDSLFRVRSKANRLSNLSSLFCYFIFVAHSINNRFL